MFSIKTYIEEPRYLLLAILRRFSSILPDKIYLQLLFHLSLGYRLNLENPKTFNEKLNWLKLYSHNPLYTHLVDKFAVKSYVSKIIGNEYIIPTLGIWNDFEEIDFGHLPDRFVLKTTHGGGNTGVVICKNKQSFNFDKAKKKLTKSLKTDMYKNLKEWPYKNVEKRILAEEYMEDEYGELRDYKFLCFNGIPKIMFIATNRSKGDSNVKFDFFDMEFNHLPFTQGHPNSNNYIERPIVFDHMKFLAMQLSRSIPHVRVDFYVVNGKIYFGEMTFFHFAGMKPFNPVEWDMRLGEWLDLPSVKIIN